MARLLANAGEDSVSFLPAIRGDLKKPLREATVHHSINGSFSIRQGNWKLEFCPGSGGWSDPKPKKARKLKLPEVQLYDLEKDIAETKNVHEAHPAVVEKLTKLMQSYIERGRSTSGAPQNVVINSPCEDSSRGPVQGGVANHHHATLHARCAPRTSRIEKFALHKWSRAENVRNAIVLPEFPPLCSGKAGKPQENEKKVKISPFV
jgi:hypothetical protein